MTIKKCLFKNEIMLKLQPRFKSYSVYTEVINKIALSSYDDKRLQTFDQITSYPYGTNAGKVCKTELLEYANTKWLILMIILIKKRHNLKWPYLSDHPYRILIIGGSGSVKTNHY